MQKEQFQKKIDSFGIMKSEWLKKQVGGHLVFGLLSRYIPCLLLAAIGYFLFLLWDAISAEKTISSYVRLADFMGGCVLVAGFIYGSLYFSKYQQAVIAWFSIKASFGIAALVLMTVGTLTSVSKHQSDALPNFLLGFVWLPWIEFIPVVVPYQKFVTIARLILTIPIVYLGIQTGYWSWN